MEIRKANISEIPSIKQVIDATEAMDVIPETFPVTYFERILEEEILLVAVEKNEVVGVCFGKFNQEEQWADLLGLVVKENWRKKGIGSALVKAFENFCKEKNIKTIDLYADSLQLHLFKKLQYSEGRTYTAFRKNI